MKLFDAFMQRAPNKIIASVVLGFLSGIAYALLIPLISASLEKPDDMFPAVDSSVSTFITFEVAHYSFAKVFLVTCLFILATKTLSQIILTRVALDVTSDMRIKMYKKIRSASIRDIEQLGGAKLLASLTTDVPRIVSGSKVMPELLVNCVTLIGMLSFLLYLNSAVFWFAIQCILFGAVTYQIPIVMGSRYFKKSREHVDKLHESIHGLIYGAKELKINTRKCNEYFDQDLLTHERKVLNADKTGHTIIYSAMNYGSMISFFVIGAVIFVFVNYHSITQAELISVVMVLLYLTGPIKSILSYAPMLSEARVSLKKVNNLFSTLPEEIIESSDVSFKPLQSVRFSDVVYTYGSDKTGFNVGPLSFELSRGQVTFIIGGNGSGKSTLSKLLTQHYRNDSGKIYFNSVEISNANIVSARDCISAIYSDYYLFNRVLGESENTLSNIQYYLEAFDLDSKTKYENDRFSTLALSDGQRRRLALLVAYLEDKDFYLFDEWAADQDPTFKEVFYNDILRDLKNRGKIVVVISHDDRFFKLADQVIHLEQGKIQKIEYQSIDSLDSRFSRENALKEIGM